MFSLTTNNTETIVDVTENAESLELMDLENNEGPRKVSGASGSGRGGSGYSGSSRGRRASIFSAFSNFRMNHRPSCFSRLSEISPSFSMVSFYELNYRKLFFGIMGVIIVSVIFIYFFVVFFPNSYIAKFPGRDKFNYFRR